LPAVSSPALPDGLASSRSAADRPGLARRVIVALALVTVAPPLVVSLIALAQRAAGRGPTPGLVWLASIVAAVGLGLATLAGRGPLVAFAARLDPAWDGTWHARRGVAFAWILLALVGAAQVGRLSLFMADPALRGASTYPPVDEGVTHMCMSAYVHAGDLSRRGDPNLYDEHHYPAFLGGTLGHAAPMTSPVANLAEWLEDPFEYPPPFLLLPRLGLALSNDFLVLRTGWFALKLAVLFAALLVVGRALAAERRRFALLLAPALLASLPIMFDLQFGQAHLIAILAAMGGMLAFARGRRALGGALLGASVAAKVFPGILLVYLLLRRDFRAVAWTIGAVGVYALAGLLVLGPAPFATFYDYQLPRIASGEAFSFFMRSDLTIAANWGVFGIPIKLGRLGVPGMTTGVARAVTWVYTFFVLGATVVAARRRRAAERGDAEEPLVWLALLILGSLRSPLAPNVYVGAPALWLLALLAPEVRRRPLAIALYVVSFIAIGGLPPMPSPEATIVVWMSGQLAMLALGFWIACRVKRAQV
jgi:hypothetical protein